MSDLTKKIILGAVFLMVVTIILIKVEQKNSSSPDSEYTTPPVPVNILTFEAKERELKKAIEQAPTNRDLLFRLGALYFENNRFTQAIEVYRKILKINEKDVDTLNDLGLALHYTGNSTEAIEVLKKATSYAPSHQRVWLSLGFVLASSGRTEEAKDPLNRAISLGPDNSIGKEAIRILSLIEKNSR